MIHLSGSMSDSSNDIGGFAVLPPKTAPANDIDMNTYIYGGAVGDLSVVPEGFPTEPPGGFWVQDEGVTDQAQQFASLAGITYPVVGTLWQPLPLQSGYEWQYGYNLNGPPAYWISQGVVYLTGVIGSTSGTGTGGLFAILPPAARPAHNPVSHRQRRRPPFPHDADPAERAHADLRTCLVLTGRPFLSGQLLARGIPGPDTRAHLRPRPPGRGRSPQHMRSPPIPSKKNGSEPARQPQPSADIPNGHSAARPSVRACRIHRARFGADTTVLRELSPGDAVALAQRANETPLVTWSGSWVTRLPTPRTWPRLAT